MGYSLLVIENLGLLILDWDSVFDWERIPFICFEPLPFWDRSESPKNWLSYFE